jgi:cyclopropane fatty-acyl-phospholipid synthase-like methyltransferase
VTTTNPIDRESAVHGEEWSNVHGGYFGDPEVARPLVDAVAAVLAETGSEVLVDLGGGTGFLLSQVMPRIGRDVRLVNLDLSARQLGSVTHPRIRAVERSITDFVRSDIDDESKLFTLMMRSVLHYLGRDYPAALRHLRAQLRPGEYLVHQTATFADAADADCLNRLYDEMGTGKHYPSSSELVEHLEACGFEVRLSCSAEKLCLTAAELSDRYSVAPDRIAAICDAMFECFAEKPGVLERHLTGFAAYLHYCVYTCRAV